MGEEKTLILGLDSVPPRLLYKDLQGELPNIESLLESRGILKTSHPPITIPAWMVLSTGRTPGELGIYGFRHRRARTYDDMYIANSRLVKHKTFWDKLGGRGKRVIIAGVPPSYPPKPVKGLLVSCFITPGPENPYTWPPTLKREIEKVAGGPYIFDVVYRSEDKDRVKKELWSLAETQFKVVRYLAREKKWDLLFYMHIGTDRVHHAFWKYYDREHHKYEPGNEYEDVIPEYYKLVDMEIGKLLEVVPRGTRIILVSDHGAKAMKGAFAINQWLEENGYLTLKRRPERPGQDLKPNMIDWSRTKAWAWGGYYSRIFLNIKGREPQGIVDPEDAPGLIEQLKRDIERIGGPNGEHWKNMVYMPQELYPEVNGDPPDLMVYLDDLNWRPAGTIGWPEPYLEENDRGPDDAVHDWYGIIAENHTKSPINSSTINIIDFTKVMEGLDHD